MNADTVNVSGVPGMPDGVLSATIADAWFDAERTASFVQIARRIERLHHKASRQLAIACDDLDAALRGHVFEPRLRNRLLEPLQRDCALLSEIAERVQVRLSLFAPARSQAAFERGMALQLQDINGASEVGGLDANDGHASPPEGYLLSEDSFSRLERARGVTMLLASLGEGNGERMAINFEAMAASAAYVFDDLGAVVSEARHTSDLDVSHAWR